MLIIRYAAIFSPADELKPDSDWRYFSSQLRCCRREFQIASLDSFFTLQLRLALRHCIFFAIFDISFSSAFTALILYTASSGFRCIFSSFTLSWRCQAFRRHSWQLRPASWRSQPAFAAFRLARAPAAKAGYFQRWLAPGWRFRQEEAFMVAGCSCA